LEISYDRAKSARNIEQRGLSFDRAADFDFESALFTIDARRHYGEVRRVAIGMIAAGYTCWYSLILCAVFE
jgi:uncharacterized DUF497 family protein